MTVVHRWRTDKSPPNRNYAAGKFVFYKRLCSAGTEALIAICSPPSIIYRKEIFIGKRLCAHHWNPHDIFQVTWICLNVWFTLGKLRKTSSGGHANLL